MRTVSEVIKEFIISSTYAGLTMILADFEEHGCQ